MSIIKKLCFLILVFLLLNCKKDKNPELPKLNYDWVQVKGGTFIMGRLTGEGEDCELPAHEVTLSDFNIGKYEVTNAQFAQFMNAYKSDTIKKGKFAGERIVYEFKWGLVKTDSGWWPVKSYENHPVLNVTWAGANEFCKFYGFRLPTEAEWEFAALGGNSSFGYLYSGSDTATVAGWCSPDYEDMPGLVSHPVGLKKPNELGIYDMCGNAWEWVFDYYGNYSNNAQYNPTGPEKGNYHVYRGGCWLSIMFNCRIKTRTSDELDFHGITHNGFRCAK